MKLLIVDGNNILFKAYYATVRGRPMTSLSGEPTGAVFGFINMLQKAIDMVKPQAIMVAFDAGKHTFRHDLYPDYKGGRTPAPDDLVPQFQSVRELLDAWNIRWAEREDIEADDLIGTLAAMAKDWSTYILSGDHDLMQLVDENTTMLMSKKGLTEMTALTPTTLKEMMGIRPDQVIDLKGLMGDHSDNIPGIAGIGEKTALKLLEQYETVENVLANDQNIKGALGTKIQNGHEIALLSKKLATIQRDVQLGFGPDDCLFTPDYDHLISFLEALNMRSLIGRYAELKTPSDDHTPEDAGGGVKCLARTYVKSIPEEFLTGETAVFVDGTKEHYLDASVNGMALCDGVQSFYISLDDLKSDEKTLAYLKAETPAKYGYDVKRNMHLLRKAGIEAIFRDDLMIAASLVDSTLTSDDKIAQAFGLSFPIGYEEVYGKPGKPTLLTDEKKQLAYACQKAEAIYRLADEILPVIEKEGMHELYYDMEMPLTGILLTMEEIGIRCDINILNEIAERTRNNMEKEQQAIYELAGKPFNINSPKQLQTILYDELGLAAGKKKSTAAETLEKLRDRHPIIEHILNYRKTAKLYSTYAEGLKRYIRKDGRIHTVYNQAATQTGRLSSSDPNLQNIAVRDEQGREIRRAFLPDEGCVLIASDYHQIELRMLADMADEPALIAAFNSDTDIHTKTAMALFGVGEEEVTSAMRRQAKTVNFGIVYGISDFGLAEQLGSDRKEAGSFIEQYYRAYPGIRTYMAGLIKSCEDRGYAETLCHRRRRIPEIHDKNRMVSQFGKRAAMNAPIQGSAADLIKLAMIDIDRMMRKASVKSRMILQVHDELIFNVPEEEIALMKRIINDGMVNAMKLKVPLTAQCSVGKDWYEAK